MLEPETTPRPGTRPARPGTRPARPGTRPAPASASLRPRTAAISCPTPAASGQCCGVARVLPRALGLICPSETSRGRWFGPQTMGLYRLRAETSTAGTGTGGRCGAVAGQRRRRPRSLRRAGRDVLANRSRARLSGRQLLRSQLRARWFRPGFGRASAGSGFATPAVRAPRPRPCPQRGWRLPLEVLSPARCLVTSGTLTALGLPSMGAGREPQRSVWKPHTPTPGLWVGAPRVSHSRGCPELSGSPQGRQHCLRLRRAVTWSRGPSLEPVSGVSDHVTHGLLACGWAHSQVQVRCSAPAPAVNPNHRERAYQPAGSWLRLCVFDTSVGDPLGSTGYTQHLFAQKQLKGNQSEGTRQGVGTWCQQVLIPSAGW